MTEVKRCVDCVFSTPDSKWINDLYCRHPKVNSRNAWFLSHAKNKGKNCYLERTEKGIFAICGMKGKLFTPKDKT